MEDAKERLKGLLQQLETEREELKLQLGLAKLEAREEWQELEGKMDTLRGRLKVIGEEAREAGGDVAAAADVLVGEIKDGLSKIRRLVLSRCRHQPGGFAMEKIKVEHHSFGGMIWFGAWLFTLGYLQLGFWKGILAVFVWPYFPRCRDEPAGGRCITHGVSHVGHPRRCPMPVCPGLRSGRVGGI